MFIGIEEIEFLYENSSTITVIFKDEIINDEYSFYNHHAFFQSNYKYLYALKSIKEFMRNNWQVCYTDFYGDE